MPSRGIYNRIMPINCVQPITGYGSMVLCILRYLRSSPGHRTIRVRAHIYSFIARSQHNCDRTTVRLVLALVRRIVQNPAQESYRTALPIIIDLVEQYALTGHDRQIMTYLRVLAQCLDT